MGERAMDGKVVVVTGGSSGLGKEAALALAKMGAEVHLVCRNREKGEAAVRELRERSGNPKVSSFYADLSLIKDTRRVAREIDAALPRIDVLVNNAGFIAERYEETSEGHEKTFATNHLGYFVLTTELLPKLKAQGTPVRIVSVSSGAHMGGPFKLDDPSLKQGWSSFGSYGQSKLMNILFTFELAKRLQGTRITATCLHPGAVATQFGQSAKGITAFFFGKLGFLLRTPAKGADTIVWLASSPECEGRTGEYFQDRKRARLRKLALDPAAQKGLWELSEKLAAAVP